MLGDIVQLANNLWLVMGDMPADVPNALVYYKGDRLYLMDSGAGPAIRASILQVLHEVGPVQSFTLLNSHGHADHVGNNDLIHLVQAKQKHHYLSEPGLTLLDAPSYFATQFSRLSAYYDPVTGFQAHRLRWRAVGALRDLAQALVGERRALELIFSLYLRKFRPLRPSPDTIQTYESLPRQPLTAGGVPWTGWALGDDDVWILEARGHAPDEVLFYLPKHQLLHTADLTLPLFPTFPNSDGTATREVLGKCQAMAAAGAIGLLTDGHHHLVYRGREEAAAFLGTLLSEHEHFQTVLREIVEAHDGLTVAQIYAHLQQRHGDPVVHHYLSLEFPYLPMALQQIITVSLLQMGYETNGPRRKQHFYQPRRATESVQEHDGQVGKQTPWSRTTQPVTADKGGKGQGHDV